MNLKAMVDEPQLLPDNLLSNTMKTREQPGIRSSNFLFVLYGTRLEYTTTSPFLAAPVNKLLKHFRQNWTGESAELRLCFHAVEDREHIPWVRSPSTRLLYPTTDDALDDPREGLKYALFEDEDDFVVEFRDIGVLIIDSVRGVADGYVIKPEACHVNVIEYVFNTALVQLLRRRELYSIHAAALENHGLGILIPGMSGRGKTTSFISLLRSGYRYLSDDHPLIRDSGTHIDVLPFPIDVNVTESTIAIFPELRDASDGVLHSGSPKRYFKAEKLYPSSEGKCCAAALMLFPIVIPARRSHIEPLPKSRALEELLPQALLVFDHEIAKREFQVLARLVQQVDCYRLHFGQDILDLPKLVAPLLEKRRG